MYVHAYEDGYVWHGLILPIGTRLATGGTGAVVHEAFDEASHVPKRCDAGRRNLAVAVALAVAV